LSVTRATTATRVNSAGLVELVPYNSVPFSQEFNNGVWSYYLSTITPNSTIAPDGTTSADTIAISGTNGSTYQSTSLGEGTYTISAYFKKINEDNVYMDCGIGGYFGASFNLTTEVITPFGGAFNFNMEDVGNGWFRCSVQGYANGSGGYGFGVYASGGQSAYIWGAQLNEGTIKPYQKTETRLNIPRLDYSNGTCPSLLVEPQRTNLLWYSEQFDNATYWSPFNATITGNTAISPSGTNTADTLTSNAVTGGDVYRLITLNGTYTTSAFFKSGNASIARIAYSNGNTANFNLSNGTYTISGGTSASIEDAGNGWWRCTFTTTITSGALVAYGVDGASGNFVYLWGAQLEVGTYATSYIPTTSASVTRNADVISKTGISSLIGQTEGTLFVDVYRPTSNSPFIFMIANSVGANAYLNSIYLYQLPTAQLTCDVFVSGVLQASIVTSLSGLAVGRNKIAIAYKQNDFALYINGTQIGTDTSGNVPTMSAFEINGADISSISNVETNAAALWKTRLTNTQLAQLTTI
jgi:hypothetical protein